jgi:hypothetical protein
MSNGSKVTPLLLKVTCPPQQYTLAVMDNITISYLSPVGNFVHAFLTVHHLGEGENSVLYGPWNFRFKSSPNQIKFLDSPLSLYFRSHFICNHFAHPPPPPMLINGVQYHLVLLGNDDLQYRRRSRGVVTWTRWQNFSTRSGSLIQTAGEQT